MDSEQIEVTILDEDLQIDLDSDLMENVNEE
jgi:hypothetical protein